jgi:hypothetical protein
MKSFMASALLGTSLALAACGGGADETAASDEAGAMAEPAAVESGRTASGAAGDRSTVAGISAEGDAVEASAEDAESAAPAAVGAGMAPGAGEGVEPEGSPGQNEAMRGSAPVGGAAGDGGPAE